MIVEKRLRDMGLQLGEVGPPRSHYVWAKRAGHLLYLSGHGPFTGEDSRQVYKGKVGREISLEQGQEAARFVALNCLSSIRDILGDLDKVKNIVKVTTYVNCVETLEEYPRVADAISDLLIAAFGEAGKHTRMSIGVHQNPHSIPVAMDMIVEFAD